MKSPTQREPKRGVWWDCEVSRSVCLNRQLSVISPDRVLVTAGVAPARSTTRAQRGPKARTRANSNTGQHLLAVSSSSPVGGRRAHAAHVWPNPREFSWVSLSGSASVQLLIKAAGLACTGPHTGKMNPGEEDICGKRERDSKSTCDRNKTKG